MTAEWNFVRQQGFTDASPEASQHLFPALMWQPRAIGSLVLVGMVLQAWPWFLGVSTLLLWSALWPGLNPFDFAYNSLVAKRRGLPRLGRAPSPRRFAQALAGTFLLAIGLLLLSGWHILAWAVEALMVAAQGVLMFGRFCLGSYLFLLFTGQGRFASQTLPWSSTEQSLPGSGRRAA